MNNETADLPATDGPVPVREGPDDSHTLIVIDPQGETTDDELPATWQSRTDMAVVWWHPAARHQGTTPQEPFSGIETAYLIGAGETALLTLSLAVAHRAQVRSVVLVDPPWPIADLPYVRRIVDDHDLAIQQVETGDNLPLSHPSVVTAVMCALAPTRLGQPPMT
jgi:hypothetical protein